MPPSLRTPPPFLVPLASPADCRIKISSCSTSFIVYGESAIPPGHLRVSNMRWTSGAALPFDLFIPEVPRDTPCCRVSRKYRTTKVWVLLPKIHAREYVHRFSSTLLISEYASMSKQSRCLCPIGVPACPSRSISLGSITIGWTIGNLILLGRCRAETSSCTVLSSLPSMPNGLDLQRTGSLWAPL
ncbi:hypothetical protein NEOLEDRAFT_1133340, partial [Neolentinus lepideus HHB14362 ss-1]